MIKVLAAVAAVLAVLEGVQSLSYASLGLSRLMRWISGRRTG